MDELTWAEPCPGFAIRTKRGVHTVFRRNNGLWELVDARYDDYEDARERALAEAVRS